MLTPRFRLASLQVIGRGTLVCIATIAGVATGSAAIREDRITTDNASAPARPRTQRDLSDEQLDAALRSGSSTVDRPVYRMYIPRQLDDSVLFDLFSLFPDISEAERNVLAAARASIIEEDMRIRRSRLPPLWELSADCNARTGATSAQRISMLQELQRRRRVAVNELLDRESAIMIESLHPRLGEERAVQISSRLTLVRKLDQRRVSGAVMPMAGIDLLPMLGAVLLADAADAAASGQSAGAVLEPLLNELAAAHAAFDQAREATLLQDERYRSDLESLPDSTPETQEALRKIRFDLQSDRRRMLAKRADAEDRIATLRTQLIEAAKLLLSPATARSLDEAVLRAAYGDAIEDPWDLRPLIAAAEREWGLSPKRADELSLPADQSVERTRQDVRLQLDSYWRERARSFSYSAIENEACVKQVGRAYEAAKSRVTPLADALVPDLAPDSQDRARKAIRDWIAKGDEETQRRPKALRLWGS